MNKGIINMILLLTSSISLLANEIQVFTANTQHMELVKGTKLEKVYSGELSEFYKNSESIFKQKVVGNAALSSSYLAAGAAAGANGNTASATGAGSLAGLALGAGISWLISDNEYVYLSVATNPDGKTTMLQTLIVANNGLSDEEVQEIGLENQTELIKEGIKSENIN